MAHAPLYNGHTKKSSRIPSNVLDLVPDAMDLHLMPYALGLGPWASRPLVV